MAKRGSLPVPSASELNDAVLGVVSTNAEPVAAKAVATTVRKSLSASVDDINAAIDGLVSAGKLFRIAGKTAKAPPRFSVHDVRTSVREELKSLATGALPQTAAQLLKQLKQKTSVSASDVAALLDELATQGDCFVIPAATKTGGLRYWHRSANEFYSDQLVAALAERGPTPEPQAAKLLKGVAAADVSAVVRDGITAGRLFRHPPRGKSKGPLLATWPTHAADYLEELHKPLAAIVQLLQVAGVSTNEIRRGCVQLLESCGVLLGVAATSTSLAPGSPSTAADAIDADQSAILADVAARILAVIREIEPAADQGALVSARELRRGVGGEKRLFDAAALLLQKQQTLSLHRHDYPMSLTDDERRELIFDGRGTYFVGVAIRRNA